MNQLQIEQYVAGRMSQADAEAFEEYCLENPEFARQVEFEQRLRSGMAQVAKGTHTEFVRSNHPPRLWLGVAAALLVCLSVGFYAFHAGPAGRRPVLASLAGGSQQPSGTLRLALVRGTETSPMLQDGMVRVEIVGLFDTGLHYSVALDRLEAQKPVHTLATLYGQHAASPMSLEVLIDSDQLKPGSYSLRVRKQSSNEEALDFSFFKN